MLPEQLGEGLEAGTNNGLSLTSISGDSVCRLEKGVAIGGRLIARVLP